MDYLSLTKKFWTFNDVYPLSAPIVAIYLFLLDNWDKVGGKDFLRNLGLISFQITNGFPTLYRIIPDYLVRNFAVEREKAIVKQVIKKRGEKSVSQLGEFLKTSEMPKK